MLVVLGLENEADAAPVVVVVVVVLVLTLDTSEISVVPIMVIGVALDGWTAYGAEDVNVFVSVWDAMYEEQYAVPQGYPPPPR